MKIQLLAVFASILFSSSVVGQETIVLMDYKVAGQNQTSYAFGGYGKDGDEENTVANDSFSATSAQTTEGGNPNGCLTATLDASKSKIPDYTSWDYVGWGAGSTIDLPKAWEGKDLGDFTVSFDVKVSGTSFMSSSKFLLSFVVADDQLAKDDDDEEDLVLKLGRGDDDGTDTFTITNEYKNVSFNLKTDLVVRDGDVANLGKVKVKRINFIVQAQGEASDVGKDNDNVLFIDNVKIVKTKSEVKK
jgi:hypothetical protein